MCIILQDMIKFYIVFNFDVTVVEITSWPTELFILFCAHFMRTLGLSLTTLIDLYKLILCLSNWFYETCVT